MKTMKLPESFEKIVDKFIELHGDSVHGETEQVRCGLCWIEEQKYVVIIHNHQSSSLLAKTGNGNDLLIGYRKSLRMLKLAEQLGKPVLWWVKNVKVDEVFTSLDLLYNINTNIQTILNLKVPIIGVFSSAVSKSAIISPNILDHAVILTDNDETLEKPSGDVEVINLADLSSLKTHLSNFASSPGKT